MPLQEERDSFEVPMLPVFVHERLSTRAIIESIEIDKLGLSAEICDYLESKNLWCIGHLIEYTYDNLLKLDDMTPDIANRIVEKLQNKFGITLPLEQENTD